MRPARDPYLRESLTGHKAPCRSGESQKFRQTGRSAPPGCSHSFGRDRVHALRLLTSSPQPGNRQTPLKSDRRVTESQRQIRAPSRRIPSKSGDFDPTRTSLTGDALGCGYERPSYPASDSYRQLNSRCIRRSLPRLINTSLGPWRDTPPPFEAPCSIRRVCGGWVSIAVDI
jgi:hypothetical protein